MKLRRIAFALAKGICHCLVAVLKLVLLLIAGKVLMNKRTDTQETQIKTLARQESQNRINEFVSIISHDLKTPLTSIKGNTQLMVRKLGHSLETNTIASEETKRSLVDMQRLLERTDQQITHLTHMINSLLESSRIYANTMDLLFELCELNALLSEVVQNTRYLPAERTVRLEIATEKTLLVMADINRIKQVILHYLKNAHNYSALDRPIQITLHEEAHTALVQVRDEGQGIPHREQERIWQRFYRVPGIETLNGSEVGLGLGLHICRTIVEQHHGQVGVKSSPGQGSTFWFTLPLLETEAK